MYELLALEEEQMRLEIVSRIKWLKGKSFYDELARLAAYIGNTPIALITIVAEFTQTFQGSYGVNISGTERKDSVCQYTLVRDQNDPLIINDLGNDKQFESNILVTDDPKIKFYCGIPFKTRKGVNVGAICIIDTEARTVTTEQVEHMKLLARILEDTIDG